MSDITNKAIIARLRDVPTDLNVQAADIIEELMAENDKIGGVLAAHIYRKEGDRQTIAKLQAERDKLQAERDKLRRERDKLQREFRRLGVEKFDGQ